MHDMKNVKLNLDLVKQILNECDEVIIAITSSQFNYLDINRWRLYPNA